MAADLCVDGVDFLAAREHVIREAWGPTIYALLKERNPHIDMILNAGIVAGLGIADQQRRLGSSPWRFSGERQLPGG